MAWRSVSPVEIAAPVAAGVAIGTYATTIGAGGGFLMTPLLAAGLLAISLRTAWGAL